MTPIFLSFIILFGISHGFSSFLLTTQKSKSCYSRGYRLKD